MLGETDENWRDCVRKTVELTPDSVTIYQMELPFNTTISGDLLNGDRALRRSVRNWATKRRWVERGIRGLRSALATTSEVPIRLSRIHRHPLRLSRSFVAGRRHGRPRRGLLRAYQRRAPAESGHWEKYSAAIARGELPLGRAYRPTAEERMIRELVLQIKLGSIRPAYFSEKYGVDVLTRFRDQLGMLLAEGFLAASHTQAVTLTRQRPAARRMPAESILPSAAHRDPLHLEHRRQIHRGRVSQIEWRSRCRCDWRRAGRIHRVDAVGAAGSTRPALRARDAFPAFTSANRSFRRPIGSSSG